MIQSTIHQTRSDLTLGSELVFLLLGCVSVARASNRFLEQLAPAQERSDAPAAAQSESEDAIDDSTAFLLGIVVGGDRTLHVLDEMVPRPLPRPAASPSPSRNLGSLLR